MIYYGLILPIVCILIFLIVEWKKTKDFKLVFDKVFPGVKGYLYFLCIIYIALEFYSSYGATVNGSKELIQLSWKYKGELVILLGSIAFVECFHNIGLFLRKE